MSTPNVIQSVRLGLNYGEPASIITNSPYDRLHNIKEHIHTASQVYPTLADGVILPTVSDASTWTLGAITQVVPASTITSIFDIHFISIEDISANGVFELVLYYGAGDTECGRVRFIRDAVQSATLDLPIQTSLIPANSRIRARLASADNGGQTATISVFYHTY